MTRRRKTKPVITGAAKSSKHIDKYDDKAKATRAKRDAQRERPSVLQIEAAQRTEREAQAAQQMRDLLGQNGDLPEPEHKMLFGDLGNGKPSSTEDNAARIIALHDWFQQPDADPV